MPVSAPVVVGDRVFVTAEPDVLVCVHRDSGAVRWKQSTRFDDLPKAESVKPEKPPTECGYTTPTPVSDGNRVAVLLGNGLAACYDLEGKRQWVRYLGVERMPNGRSASPAILGRKADRPGDVSASPRSANRPSAVKAE